MPSRGRRLVMPTIPTLNLKPFFSTALFEAVLLTFPKASMPSRSHGTSPAIEARKGSNLPVQMGAVGGCSSFAHGPASILN